MLRRQTLTTMSNADVRAPRDDASPGSRRFPVQVRSTFVRIARRPA